MFFSKQTEAKKVYLVGIKGSGMVALAENFLAQGYKVVGSDTKEKFFTDKVLEKLKIKCYQGFSEKNLLKEWPVEKIIYSTAYNINNNQELKLAEQKNWPRFSYPEALGELTKAYLTLAVCGTHGKTTTSAMLAIALKEAGLDPSAIVGAKIHQVGSNALIGKGKFLIIEADEYQNKLSFYHPWGVILTSVDFDHPDFFANPKTYQEVFKKFVRRIPAHGFLVAYAGSRRVLEVAQTANCKIIFYSDSSQQLEEVLEEFLARGKKNIESCLWPETTTLSIPGQHNRINATAVLAVAEQLKLNKQKILNALKNYQGTARRFEKLGKFNGAEIIDDYAHHPEEIKATLRAAREKYPYKNLICVFHPHTFTRTKALLEDFSQSFALADRVIILDIYGSAREKQGEIHSQDLVKKIQLFHRAVEYIPDIATTLEKIKKELTEKDILLLLGAGNVNDLGKKLLNLT